MRARPTVVLDTNVLESAMRSRLGASFAVLSLVGRGRFDVAISVPMVLEYEEVLMRGVGRGSPRRTKTVVQDVLDYLCTVGIWQEIFFLWRPTLPDADDDMVLELAVAAGCDLIVTYNIRDFGPAKRFGIDIQTPAQFLEAIRGPA